MSEEDVADLTPGRCAAQAGELSRLWSAPVSVLFKGLVRGRLDRRLRYTHRDQNTAEAPWGRSVL